MKLSFSNLSSFHVESDINEATLKVILGIEEDKYVCKAITIHFKWMEQILSISGGKSAMK